MPVLRRTDGLERKITMFDFKRFRTKRLIEESILLAVDSISEDIQRTADEAENKTRAEAIKLLAEAYDIVHRGKKSHEI